MGEEQEALTAPIVETERRAAVPGFVENQHSIDSARALGMSSIRRSVELGPHPGDTP
jgi:hypothetical protein